MKILPSSLSVSTHILQIVGPVGVYPVSSTRVPGFWSFGTCLGSSSDGFSATVTPPRWGFGVIESEFGYPKWVPSFLFVSLKYFLFHKGRQSIRGRRRSEDLSWKREVQPRVCQERQYCPCGNRSTQENKRRTGYLQRVLFLNLMMTEPPTLDGILVTLEPTDEVPLVRTEIPEPRTKVGLFGCHSHCPAFERFV